MRLKITKSKKSTRLYAIKSTYDPTSRKTSSKVVAKLGSAEEIMQREGLSYDEAIAWAKERIAEMSAEKAETSEALNVRLRPARRIGLGDQRCANAGLLFPKKVCAEIGVRDICNELVRDEGLDFDFGETVENLVAARVLIPSYAWTRTGEYATCPGACPITPSQEYRTMTVLSRHADALISALRDATMRIHPVNPSTLYYNSLSYRFALTRFNDAGEGGSEVAAGDTMAAASSLADSAASATMRFESNKATAAHGKDGKRQVYSAAVRVGILVDAVGFPLSFDISPVGKASNPFLQTQEQAISERFGKSHFVVCVDDTTSLESGHLLGGYNFTQRDFSIEHDVQRMRPAVRSWISDPQGWRRVLTNEEVDLREASIAYMRSGLAGDAASSGTRGAFPNGAFRMNSRANALSARNGVVDRLAGVFTSELDDIFYKERWHTVEGNLPQRYFALYSPRRRQAMLDLRSLATRAKNDLAPGGCMFTMSSLPLSQPIDREQGALPSAEAMRYDGYSCFITTLSSSPISLVRKALYRQKSEEQFLLALNGLESAPDFPEDAEGMRGHFLLSYITLIVHCRICERLSAADVLLSDDLLMDTLRSMNLVKLSGEGYIPAYTRTPLTDALHRAFGFRTDCEILTSRQLRTLFKEDPLP